MHICSTRISSEALGHSSHIQQFLNFFVFVFCPSIHREGDISSIEADVITNTTDETLTEKNTISSRIFKRAGSDLYKEIVHYHRGIHARKANQSTLTP